MNTAILCLFVAAVTSCLLQSGTADDTLARFQQMRRNNELNIEKPEDADKFEAFIRDYKREYKTKAEIIKRFNAFVATLKRIKIRQEEEHGSAKFGVNNFSDWTEEELKHHLGLRIPTTPA